MEFIKKEDFKTAIRAAHLDQVIGNNDDTLEIAIREAQSETESYLRGSFDVEAVFLGYADYDESLPYNEGSTLWHDEKLYLSTQDILVGDTLTDAPEKWKRIEPRDAKILQILKDICLFHIHTAITPKNIPTIRELRYNKALRWLDMVRTGDLSTTLPRLENDNVTPLIISRPRNNFYY